jgi:hypothetical protein
MNPKTYCVVSGTVFAVVALVHLVRALAGWPITIDGWTVPVALSWPAALVAGALAIAAFTARARG